MDITVNTSLSRLVACTGEWSLLSGSCNRRFWGGAIVETLDGTGDTERERERRWRRENGRKTRMETGAETGTGAEVRGRAQDGNGNVGGDENECSGGDGNGDGTGNGNGDGNENGDGTWGGGELWYPPHQEICRVEDQALPFGTQHPLCRQEVVPAGSRQLRAQVPAPARRCDTEGGTGHQGRQGGNDDGNRDRGGDGTKIAMGARTGAETGTRIERKAGGRESLRTYEVIIEVSRKTREGGRRQRVTSKHSCKTRRLGVAIASCG